MLGDTAASRRIHSPLNTPGFGCGNSVLSRSTSSHIASRYWSVERYPSRRNVSRISGNRSSGLSPRLNRASVQPICSP